MAESGAAGHLGEPPVECVAGVLAAVGVAEHEVVVLPVFAGGEPLGGLALPMRSQHGDSALGQDE
jgi:hypothetical protein